MLEATPNGLLEVVHCVLSFVGSELKRKLKSDYVIHLDMILTTATNLYGIMVICRYRVESGEVLKFQETEKNKHKSWFLFNN